MDGSILCIGLFDSPLYSMMFYKFDGELPKKIDQRSLLAVLEYESFLDILTNSKIAAGIATDGDIEMKDQEELTLN